MEQKLDLLMNAKRFDKSTEQIAIDILKHEAFTEWKNQHFTIKMITVKAKTSLGLLYEQSGRID